MAAMQERKKHSMYSEPQGPSEDDVFEKANRCEHCRGIGYVKLLTPSGDHLARCSCVYGMTGVSWMDLKNVKQVWRDGYVMAPIDHSWFRSKNYRGQITYDITKEHKVDEWANFVKRSIKHWNENESIKEKK